ncbi:MAG: hypothetical protein ACOXZ1_01425 [Patescibacteria group bacterium]|jgi:hypothetical protein
MFKFQRFFFLFLILISFSACSTNKPEVKNDLENVNINFFREGQFNSMSEENFTSENEDRKIIIDEEIGVNRGRYSDYEFGIRFEYAKVDPIYTTNQCEIKKEGNVISNSCGYEIILLNKSPKLNEIEVINYLIPDKNKSYCKIRLANNEYLGKTYHIDPVYDEISNSEENLDTFCGQYTTHYMGHRYKFYFNSDYPDRFVVIKYGGHEPSGVLEKKDNGYYKFWYETIEFFND